MLNTEVIVDAGAELDSELIEEKKKQLEKQIIYYPHNEQVNLASVRSDVEQLDLSQSRLNAIESFAQFTQLKSVCFRQNFLKTLACDNLSADKGFGCILELDFYDNQIEKIENLNGLGTLESLDLSFNKLKKIENLDELVNLRKLYLVHNQIAKCENLQQLSKLEMLELGDNQLRQIDNIEMLKSLTEL